MAERVRNMGRIRRTTRLNEVVVMLLTNLDGGCGWDFLLCRCFRRDGMEFREGCFCCTVCNCIIDSFPVVICVWI